MTESETKTPFHDLRHAALLLAEEKKDHRVEEEGDRGGEQHRALLPGRAADHRTEEETLDQRADTHQGQAGGASATTNGRPSCP